jgi:hypothetical protein
LAHQRSELGCTAGAAVLACALAARPGQLLLQPQHPLEGAAVAAQAHLVLEAAALVWIQQGRILHTQFLKQEAVFIV